MSLRRLLPLFLLLIISFALMTYQSNKGAIAPFDLLGDAFLHINNTFHSLILSAKEPARKIMLRDEENRRLREQMNQLLLEHQRYRNMHFENQRLREILALKERERRYVATARVVSKGWDRWANSLVIDKGKNHGIARDMAVITPLGLVGKVTSVERDFSHVLLITDINFSASVKLQETRKEAILSGAGSGNCVLKYVPQEEEVKEGNVVVTSGFDDLFPSEIHVGSVTRVTKRGPGIFQHVEVRPFQETTKLDEVVIVRR